MRKKPQRLCFVYRASSLLSFLHGHPRRFTEIYALKITLYVGSIVILTYKVLLFTRNFTIYHSSLGDVGEMLPDGTIKILGHKEDFLAMSKQRVRFSNSLLFCSFQVKNRK